MSKNLQILLEHLNTGAAKDLPEKQQRDLVQTILKDVEEAYNGEFGERYRNAHAEPSERSKAVIHNVLDRGQMCFPGEPLKIADLGCGTGAETEYINALENMNCIGVERSSYFLSIAPESVIAGDLTALPLDDNSLHIVFAKASQLHLPYIQGADVGLIKSFNEAFRVLKPGGWFFTTLREGNSAYIDERGDRFFQLLSQKQLKTLFENSGFKQQL